MFSVGKQ